MNFPVASRIAGLSFLLLLLSTSRTNAQALPAAVVAAEKAHNVRKYNKKQAIQFDLVLTFGGTERYNGQITATPGSGKIRMDYKDGRTVIWDGNKVWRAPAEVPNKSARFAVFTWEYFFQLPFKLTDPGTQWETKENRTWEGKNHPTAKLSFTPGTGDAHTDWYQVYFDPETELVRASAYIVTFSRSVEKAEDNIHAISYDDFRKIKGVMFAHSWKFWDWSFENGFEKQLGSATVQNVQFVKPADDFWAAPKGAVEVKYAPGK